MDNTNFSKLTTLIDAFTLNRDDLNIIAAAFRKDLEAGLVDVDDSSMKMLKSYLRLPTGTEQGDFLALDFGGTNLRVLLIRLLGDGKYEIIKKVAKPLVVPGEYDFICAKAQAEELFDFIADMINEVVDGDTTTPYVLGHTFSFPSSQTNIYDAKLIVWTKEFATRGVEGQIVNDLLATSLHKMGLNNIRPVAVINDTVAVLLAAAYKHSDIQIGSIYATGFNTCYFEQSIGNGGMILNMECGGFDRLSINQLDKQLDENSQLPYQQRMEKMVSGRYMGELLTWGLREVWNKDFQNFTSVDISNILLDHSAKLTTITSLVKSKGNIDINVEAAQRVKDLAQAIAKRSARIVASSYVGIIWHLFAGSEIRPQAIAVDGSVFEKMPHIQEYMHGALYELLGEDAAKISLILENGGSALGAAIAACNASV